MEFEQKSFEFRCSPSEQAALTEKLNQIVNTSLKGTSFVLEEFFCAGRAHVAIIREWTTGLTVRVEIPDARFGQAEMLSRVVLRVQKARTKVGVPHYAPLDQFAVIANELVKMYA